MDDKQCYVIGTKLYRQKQPLPPDIHEGYKRYRNSYLVTQKERISEQNKKHYYKNHEKMIARNNTDDGKKAKKITRWKQLGIECDDFNELYKLYKETEVCADCDVILVESKTITTNRKCLDHDHITGLFRDVVCHVCNQIRGVTDRMLKSAIMR